MRFRTLSVRNRTTQIETMELYNTQLNLLIVDDDEDILMAARLLLSRQFKNIFTLSNPENILPLMENEKIDIFLLDMNFSLGTNSGEEGISWLKLIQRKQPLASVVLMTAYGNVKMAVEAIKLGAHDYVLKPWLNEELLKTLMKAAVDLSINSVTQITAEKAINKNKSKTPSFVFHSQEMKKIIELVTKVAPTDTNILITGENGTGKEVVAQYLHQQSMRAAKPFLAVDMGALPENLIESELFGHKKGAFTGATNNRPGRFISAQGGTLFLDEIGNIPLATQVKLLRALEEKEVTPLGSDKAEKFNVRILAATNMQLDDMMVEGTFRRDLYYRIKTIQIDIPPLRERIADISPLIEHFITIFSEKYACTNKTINQQTLTELKNYPWPGNVRELAHAVERAVIVSDGDYMQASDFLQAKPTKKLTTNLNLQSNERKNIEQALRQHYGNVSNAANSLGITRTSLYRRIKKYEL